MFPRDPQCFPGTLAVSRSRGNKSHCYTSQLKTRKNYMYEEIVCLAPASSQICRGFKEHDVITCESKVVVVVVVVFQRC